VNRPIIQSWIASIDEQITRREHRGALDAIRRETAARGAPDSQDERLLLEIMTGECLAFLGQCRDAITICRKAARALRRSADHSLYARACFVMAAAQHYVGDIDEGAENTRAALYAYKRADDVAGVVRSLNWLGNVLFYKSEYENALSSYRESIVLARKHKMQRSISVGRENMGRLLLLRGNLRGARAAFRGNCTYYRWTKEELSIARHNLSFAYLNILERRFSDAERLLKHLESNSCVASHLREHGAWLEYMGELRLSENRPEEAEVHLEQAIRLCTESGPDESVLGQSRRLLAEVRLAQGNLDEALAECDRALVSIRKVGERFEEGVVFRVIAEVHARRGEREPAIQAYRQSVEILRTIGARLEWAKTCLAAGRCVFFGERERLAYLFEAERLFADIGVQYWCEQTRTALGEILQEQPGEKTHHLSLCPEKSGEPVMIAGDPKTRETLRMARRWAATDLAVLITGETGTGKDLLARYIHAASARRDRPFVDIDLNNIPEALWESELFGHRRGTFTGASEEKAGLLEAAAGGTVFLNEIGNLPLGLQAKLLEFLDTRQIRRLGDTHLVTLDVRFIAATNRLLREAVDEGLFRDDLYFRLEQAPLHLVPLRERREDILPLMRYFLAEFGVPVGVLDILAAQPWVERALRLPWPGNIRQLRNFLWRLVTLAGPGLNIELDLWVERMLDYMGNHGNGNGSGNGNGQDHASTPMEFLETLERHDWNQRAVARDLQMTEGNVRYLIRRWKIAKPAEAATVN
jgi:DNA-binding NtrC family response regulator